MFDFLFFSPKKEVGTLAAGLPTPHDALPGGLSPASTPGWAGGHVAYPLVADSALPCRPLVPRSELPSSTVGPRALAPCRGQSHTAETARRGSVACCPPASAPRLLLGADSFTCRPRRAFTLCRVCCEGEGRALCSQRAGPPPCAVGQGWSAPRRTLRFRRGLQPAGLRCSPTQVTVCLC